MAVEAREIAIELPTTPVLDETTEKRNMASAVTSVVPASVLRRPKGVSIR